MAEEKVIPRVGYIGNPLVVRVGTAKDKGAIYVGRLRHSSAADNPLGNPFRIGEDGKRAEVIDKYRKYLWERVETDPDTWLPMLAALYGETLACHCAPELCHGEVLVKAAEWAWSEIGAEDE